MPSVGAYRQVVAKSWARYTWESVADAIPREGGVVVTIAGSTVALGVAFVGLGIYELSGMPSRPSPLTNGWAVGGLCLMLAGILFSIGVFATIVAARHRWRGHRADVSLAAFAGQDLLWKDPPVSADELSAWLLTTSGVLLKLDRDSVLAARLVRRIDYVLKEKTPDDKADAEAVRETFRTVASECVAFLEALVLNMGR